MSGLLRVLEASQTEGFLGPGPVVRHVEHAATFATAIEPPARALDLGSGGGVPALPLALTWDDARCTLVDAQLRRARFLRWAVDELELGDRVQVIHARAEELARDPEHRGAYDAVTARSFGPPGITAECGAGFLVPGGALVVAEPPGDEARWPAAGLADLGLHDEGLVGAATGHVRVLRSRDVPLDVVPRRSAAMRRSPRF